MDIEKDHYATLGVPPTATHDEIKRAYRAKALRVHPDRGGTGHVMRQLNEAWDVLGDPERRREYDGSRTPVLPEQAPSQRRPREVPLPESPWIALLGRFAQRCAYGVGVIVRFLLRPLSR